MHFLFDNLSEKLDVGFFAQNQLYSQLKSKNKL